MARVLTVLAFLFTCSCASQYRSDIGAMREAANRHDTNEVCYNSVGCFSQTAPWSSHDRPIPPPLRPGVLHIRAYAYSRTNPHLPILMETYPEPRVIGDAFDGSKPTVILLHGYERTVHEKWMYLFRDVYLDKTDGNVLIVDWTAAAKCEYLQSCANLRVVARLTGNLIRHLIRHYGADPGRYRVIGCSLAAHLAGFIGKDVTGLGWVTGLDPAEPMFENEPPEVRIAQTDAVFVEVLHSSSRSFLPNLGFGVVSQMGDIDIYFNGGPSQPGCDKPFYLPKVGGTKYLYWFPTEISSGMQPNCDHIRTQQYMIEAYNETGGCVFWAHKAVYVGNAPGTVVGERALYKAVSETCTPENCIPFGRKTNLTPLRGAFVVKTKSESPFCIREDGYPLSEVAAG